MKQILIALLLALSGSAFADSVSSPDGTFSAFPAGFSSSTPAFQGAMTAPLTTGNPFWNNPSDDAGVGGSHMMNVGYVLTDTGGLAGTPSVLGADSATEGLTDASGADPTAFSFVSTGNAINITLLFAMSSLDTGNAAQGTIFGYYVGSTYTPLYNVGDTSSPIGSMSTDPITAGSSYGFYATVCYGGGMCETYTTGNGNSGNVTGAAGWNHFALFQLASGNYAMGFTAAAAFVGEGQGDFNDVVVQFEAAPEPATIAFMALGLAGLAFFRRSRASSISKQLQFIARAL